MLITTVTTESGFAIESSTVVHQLPVNSAQKTNWRQMPEFNLTGMKNLGNTCFMNTAIQALFATEEFQQYVKDVKCQKTLHSGLTKLFAEMIASDDYAYISPDKFREDFVKEKPEFDNYDQHDCQEFLKLLIDGLHEEMNEAKNRKRETELAEVKSAKDAWNQYRKYMDDSFLVDIFVGQMCSAICCTKCEHKSERWESFWDISLSLPQNERQCLVSECLKHYMTDEVLSDDAMPTCDQCKAKQESIRSIKIERLPLILTLNLKRFENDGRKITIDVFPDEEIFVNHTPYQLYAIICHRGDTADGGHYDIFCRYTSDSWYYIDDESVEKCRDYRQIYSGIKCAYILLYHMKHVSLKY